MPTPTYFKGGLKTDNFYVTQNTALVATGNDTTQTVSAAIAAGGGYWAGTVTTGALTTAANATTAVVVTIPGLVAGVNVQATLAGGTNTIASYIQSAIATANTLTVVIRNGVNATTALNGTVKFHYVILD